MFNPDQSLDKYCSLFKGNSTMSLAGFVEVNLSVLHELKELHISKDKIVGNVLGRDISVSALAVAMSRLKPSGEKNSQVVIMEKTSQNRFVPKDARLFLGGQTEKQKIVRKGVVMGYRDVLIDWRGLHPGETVSSWIGEYRDRLIGINHLGWRWRQIADAINRHLNLTKKITTSTVTSIICLSNKKTK